MATKSKKPTTPPKTDYKPGARVKIAKNGAHSKEYKGYVDHVEVKQTGHFVYVNVGDKKNPVIKGFRALRVKGY
jgi:hypothetical protein